MEELPFDNRSQLQRQGLSSSVAFELNIQATSGFPTLVPSRGLEQRLDFRLLDAAGSGLRVPGLDDVSEAEPQSVAIHIHCYYVDELALLLQTLEQCVDAFSQQTAIFLTTDTDAKGQQIVDQIAASGVAGKLPVKCVRLVENRGRNLRPLFQDIYPLIAKYDVALHLHAKRSVGNAYGHQWLLDMLHALLPSEAGVRAILESFRAHQDLGLIMPQAGEVIRPLANWGSNFVLARMLCTNIFPDRILDPQAPLVFPAGMMFWFRPAAMQQMADACKQLISFVSEPVAADGTVLHALERLSAHFCEASGYRWALAALRPVDLQDEESASRTFAGFSVWAKDEVGYLHATRQLAEDLKIARLQLDDLRQLCDQQASRIIEFQADAAQLLRQLDATLKEAVRDDPQPQSFLEAIPPALADDADADEITGLRHRLVEILRWQAELRFRSEAAEREAREQRLLFETERCHWHEERDQLHGTLASQEKAWQQERQKLTSQLSSQEEARQQEHQKLSSQLSSLEQSAELERQQSEARLCSQRQLIADLEWRVQQTTLKLAEQLEQLDFRQQELSELQTRYEEVQVELTELRQISVCYHEAKNQNAELSILLSSQDKQIGALQWQCEESVRQYQELSRELLESRSEIHRLRDQIQAELAERSALQTQLQQGFQHRIRAACALWVSRLRFRQDPPPPERQSQGGES